MTNFLFNAGLAALTDAELDYHQIQAVVASYCYGEPTSGQRAVYELGLTGVPVFNVNNNCSSGSSALMLARRLVQSGVEDCVLALGDFTFSLYVEYHVQNMLKYMYHCFGFALTNITIFHELILQIQ